MKARQKCRLTGPTAGCWTNKDTCIEEKQRVRHSCRVYSDKQTIMKARQKCRLTGPTTGCCTNKETCIEEKQGVYVNRMSRVCECALTTCACVCCYYLPNKSTVSVCLSIHVCPCVLMLLKQCSGPMQQQAFDGSNSCHIYTRVYTHSHTFNTFTQAQYSVNSHEKHENSPKR